MKMGVYLCVRFIITKDVEAYVWIALNQLVDDVCQLWDKNFIQSIFVARIVVNNLIRALSRKSIASHFVINVTKLHTLDSFFQSFLICRIKSQLFWFLILKLHLFSVLLLRIKNFFKWYWIKQDKAWIIWEFTFA